MGQLLRIPGTARLVVTIAAVLLAMVLPTPLTLAQGTAVFSRIDVSGNQRIEADSIRVFAGIEPGQPVTPEQINLAVRSLFDTGLFEDVQVMPEAGRLVITVVENPTINEIAFEGNDSIKEEDLSTVVQLRPRLAYSVPAAEADAQRIIQAYQAAGRYAASVTPVIIRLPENRVNLVFEIDEGRVTSVQRISFTGNQTFSDRRLRGVVETNQSNWLSFLFGKATYDADRLEVDKEKLRRFYLENGFIDVRVLSGTAELARDRTGFFLSFTISEGERFNFGQMSVSSAIPGLDAAAFRPELAPVLGGGLYDVSKVDSVVERMAYLAGQSGYAFVEIRPNVTRNPASHTVDINFELVQGDRVFVERIDITGNTRTVDRVIRRQFHIVEGDAFNAREVRDAEDRIRGLGYFKTAAVSVRPGAAPDQALIQVEVEEQPTGSLSLGGAFSSSEGLSAQISLTERNFLGRGQTLTATVSASSQFANYELGFYEPALFDRDLLAGLNVYYRDRNYDEQSFNTRTAGTEPRIGFPLSEHGRLTVRYHLSKDSIYDVARDTSRIIQDEAGDLWTSSLGLTYAYDRRDSVVDPTAGFILTLNQDFAGLGGDTTYSKTRATARVYKSFFDDDLVLSAELEGGALYGDAESTRITDRFNTGGDSFRGFARNGLGPRDYCSPDENVCTRPQAIRDVDDALGGNYYSILRLDASFPLGLPEEYGIYGGVFGDVGSLWGLYQTNGSMGEIDDAMHLRSSVGVSLFVDTPFAPLRFNYAVPLEYEDYDELERFRFAVETRF
jgi:outer membrane protein insertion porin family